MSKTLQVEGKGYIKELEHGLPITRHVLGSDRAVEAVDEAPVILRTGGVLSDPSVLPTTANILRVAGIGLASTERSRQGPDAAFYEVTVSGSGWAEDSDEVVTYTARYLLTPWHHRSGRAGVSVETLAQSTSITLGGIQQTEEGVNAGHVLTVQLQEVFGERELLVDVKRVGRQCLAPMVSLSQEL